MSKKILLIAYIFTSVQAFSQQSISLGIIYGQRLNYRETVFKPVVGTSLEIFTNFPGLI